MNVIESKSTDNQRNSSLSGLFCFTFLLLVALALNPDWSDIGIVWWASVALFAAVAFLSFKNTMRLNLFYVIWLIAFLCFSGLSCLWAVNVELVLQTMKSMIVYAVLLVLLCASIKSSRDLEIVLKLLLFAITIDLIWLLCTNTSMFAANNIQAETIDRLGTEGKWNANTVGMMAATAMLLALYFRKNTKKLLLRCLYLSIIVLTCLSALLSGSRKAVVMVVAGFCGFVFLNGKGKRLRMLALAAVAVFCLYYVVMEVPFFYAVVGWRMEGFFAQLTGVGTVDHSAYIRDRYVQEAFRVWGEWPVLGVGLDCFRVMNTVKANMYAHNNYAELLADLGLIGLAIYYIAFAYCLVRILAIKQKDSLTWVFIIILVTQLVMDYGCVSYNSFRTMLLLMLSFSLVTVHKSNLKE